MSMKSEFKEQRRKDTEEESDSGIMAKYWKRKYKEEEE